jgi:putative ABC transport system permease protein
MNTIQARLASQYSELGPDSKVSIVSLLRQTVGKTTRTALLVLWGIVAGVLLIACTNVANLMLARTTARQKEITLRVALGAGRGRIMRQLLTESMLLALLGGLLGILLGACGVKLFVATNPANIPRLAEASVDGIALCFTFGVTLLAGVLFGIVPAWQCSLADLNEVLKEGSRSSGSQSAGRMRSALIVVEVALATVLLIGAGLMLQSFAKLLSTDRGFRAEHVITAELDFSVSGAGFTAWFRPTATRPQVRLKELLERLRQLPGVQSAGEAWRFLRQNNNPPVNWQVGIFGRPLMPEGQRPIADVNAVSPGFFSALGIPLLRGRDFTEADTLTAPGVALVNESFARRYFPNGDTLGQHVTLGSNPGPLDTTDGNGISSWYEIVGIVGDVKSLSAQPEPVPEIYRSYWQWPADNPKIFVRATGDATALTEVIRREIHAVFPNSPAPKIRLLTDYIGKSIAQPRFQAGLLTLFGTLALVLAAFGIYGVLAYSVTQRRREIGVRMALGAPRRNVISLIIGQGLKLTLLGAGIGMIAALAFTRVMQSLIYSIKPTDPVTFIGITLLLLAVALLACWIPARHAAGIHPMEALRHE